MLNFSKFQKRTNLKNYLRPYAKSSKVIQNKEKITPAKNVEKPQQSQQAFQKGKKFVDEVPTVHNSLFHPNITAMFAAKEARGLSFEDIGKKLGRSEVWVAAVFYRQARCDVEEERKLLEILDIVLPDPTDALTNFPLKGISQDEVITDPLIYRLHEITAIYGMPIKAIIHEKFGDGIMSAVDFTLHVSKVKNPAGDRVKIEMEGKFLSYKKW